MTVHAQANRVPRPPARPPKARQIIDGATEAFLERGYEGTSTDEIVRRTGVSKGTVYSHFADKRALFVAVVNDMCSRHAEMVFAPGPSEAPVEDALRAIVHRFVRFLLEPLPQKVYRLAVGEAQRFPEFGRAFYAAGPRMGAERVAAILDRANDRGELHVADPTLAAQQLSQLCQADLFHKAIFGVGRRPTEAEINRVAEAALSVFLRAYAPMRR